NPPAPHTLYTLSLHDALPISITQISLASGVWAPGRSRPFTPSLHATSIRFISVVPLLPPRTPTNIRTNCSTPTYSSKMPTLFTRSEEHTSELQSRGHLVCRLL